MSFTLAIVGRPNVGKSTLFNRLVGKRLALVDDQPGVTRDLREGDAKLGALRFTVIDTAGLEEATDESLQGRMRALTERAVAAADICLFMVDARQGITPVDQEFAKILLRQGAKVILAANKAEGRAGESGFLEAFSLGLGTPIAISSEHGEGMADLHEVLMPMAELIPREEPETDLALEDGDQEEDDRDFSKKPLQIAVIGRPNAGKSTLINKVLGEERLLTGPEAGITRDAISVETVWGGTRMRIFDTAGMRKKARVQEKLEKLSVSDGLRAVKFAEVVVLVIDAEAPLEQQDLRIADLSEREGRALVVAINKWDAETEKSNKRRDVVEKLERLLPQLRGVPMVTLSALTGKGLDHLQRAILEAYGTWNRRISTSKLNTWLAMQVQAHPPPAPGGRRIRIRYMTQAKTRPPTFVLFVSIPEALPESYLRFLKQGMRRDFDMPGVPLRLFTRKGENPYADKKVRRTPDVRKTGKHKHRGP